CTMPCRFRSRRICSRNFLGIAWALASSGMEIDAAGGSCAKAIKARRAYLALWEIIQPSQLQPIAGVIAIVACDLSPAYLISLRPAQQFAPSSRAGIFPLD